jgi:hypothetical protein
MGGLDSDERTSLPLGENPLEPVEIDEVGIAGVPRWTRSSAAANGVGYQ